MKEFTKLLNIMKMLRDPDKGCSWDRKQTETSLRDFVLEETYELLEAIEKKDHHKLKEELGDLLLQIVFLTTIQEEKNAFRMKDVLNTINQKLINRHPHIFSRPKKLSPTEVRANWERIKMKEKNKNSIISDYPEKMPALLTARRIAAQASTVGFDWQDAKKALKKVEEEFREVKKDLESKDMEKIDEEIGDLLFAVANVSRLLNLNPELALTYTNKKFIRRFRFIEKSLKNQGKTIEAASLDEMEALWQQSKKDIK